MITSNNRDGDFNWHKIPPNNNDGPKHSISINHDAVHPGLTIPPGVRDDQVQNAIINRETALINRETAPNSKDGVYKFPVETSTVIGRREYMMPDTNKINNTFYNKFT